MYIDIEMRRVIYIGIIIFVVVCVIVVGVAIWGKFSKSPRMEVAPPKTTNVEFPMGVRDRNGKEMSGVTLPSNMVDLLEGNHKVEDDELYAIYYYDVDSSFNITLKIDDVVRARNEAEKGFLRALNITEKEACKLRVSLGVPMSVNREFGGRDYHLSFCPDGKPFK